MALQQAVFNADSLRNFKEFLEMYNKTTETCFRHCVVDLHQRDVTSEEEKCLNDCTTKTANLNHRVLQAFMVEQPRIVQQKVDTAQKEAEAAMERMRAEGIDPESVTPEEMAVRMMKGMQSPNMPPPQSK